MRTLTLSGFLRKTSFWTQQAGVRWTLLLSLASFWFLMSWLRNEYGQEDTSLWLVIRLFALLIQWTLIALVVFSTGAALVTWLYFRNQLKRKAVALEVRFGDGQKAEAGWVAIGVSFHGQLWRPLFGSVQAQLVFADKQLSLPVLLDQNIRKGRQLWRSGIRGEGRTWLHDRGIHDVEHVLVTFVDMLSLVSLPTTIDAVKQVYTLPKPQPPKTVAAQPHSTEEQKHRIDVSKRVEGEYVNYKEFETGDNIRRIVWKIYAKSGQLVVRIPEIKDPYASHLYFYVSYYNGLRQEPGAFEQEMLNVYKDYVRNLFEALAKNGYDVRIPPDQEVPHLAGVGEKKRELFQIAAAAWQGNNAPTAFVHPGKAAFVCLPSLVPSSEIATLIKRLPDAVPVVVVKLSEAIPSPFRFQVKDIFFAPEPQPADALSKPWMISGLRKDLLRNEKEIESLLRQRPQAWLTTTVAFEQV